ncbi:MAG: S-layer homology domain-containing protein [Microthrixaceae bacterium]|nr:S-layer homology domain-containing protein [Microthrixaceae bacterium]
MAATLVAAVPTAAPAAAEQGDITTFTDVDGEVDEPTDLVVAPDGTVWFTSHANDLIGRLDPGTGEITTFGASEFNIEGPNHLAVTDDGIVWFTNEDNDRIGRLDPDTGVVNVFEDARFRDPGGITAGPDGNVWFTAPTTTGSYPTPGWIGRITPSGQITLVPLPGGRQASRGIVLGPDQRLWFVIDEVAINSRNLGALDPDTLVTAVYGTNHPGPEDLTVGADGNIWYVYQQVHFGGEVTHWLDRLSLDTFTVDVHRDYFHDRGANVAIAPGPDLSMWFVNGGSWSQPTDTRVGRSSLAAGGRTTSWDDPGESLESRPDIAAAPDGSVWYTSPSLDRIARVDTAGPDVSITKSRDESSVVAGHDIHYHVTVTNSGTEPLTNVTLDDANAPACAGPVGDLAVGQAVTVDCAFTTGVGQSGTYPNVATVDTDQTGPVDSNQVTTRVDRHPSVAVSLAARDAEVVQGEAIHYRATVTNTGDIPLTGVATTGAGSTDCTRSIGGLAVGEDVVVECERPTAPGDVGTVITTMEVDTAETTPVTSNQVSVQVGTERSVAIAQVADAASVPAGDAITYHVTVTNTGDIPLRQVAEIDGPDSVQVSEIGTLVPDQQVTVDRSYPTAAADLGTFTNVATVIARNLAPQSTDELAVEVTIPPAGFVDVPDGAFYADGADWAAFFEVLPGYGDGTYRADKAIDRARLVSALWRMMDRPEGAPHAHFTDVRWTQWFKPALDWAVDEGLFNGASRYFRPKRAMTRAEVVRRVWQMVGAPTDEAPHGYPDVPAGAGYWCVTPRAHSGR